MKNSLKIKNAFLDSPLNEKIIILDCELISGKIELGSIIKIDNFKIKILKIESQRIDKKYFIYLTLFSEDIKMYKYYGQIFEIMHLTTGL